MTTLSQIPENGTFQVAKPYTIGGGEHFERGGCQVTLLPDRIYTVEQTLADFSVAIGICHIEQRSETFGNVDKVENISFTIDNDLTVIPLVQTNVS